MQHTHELKPGRRGGSSARPVRDGGDSYTNSPIKRVYAIDASQAAARMQLDFDAFKRRAEAVGVAIFGPNTPVDFLKVGRLMYAANKPKN